MSLTGKTSSMTLGIAVIGLGYWGKNYLRLLSTLPGVRLLYMCDEFQQAVAEHTKAYPEVTGTTDLEHILSSTEVHAVVIVTPATKHFDIARRCLQAGKHVLAEKPLTTSSEHASLLIQLAKDCNLTLMTGHTFLHNSSVIELKKRVAEQAAFGRIYSISCTRTNMGPFRKDVDCTWDLAPHDISILIYLLEEVPQWVSAVGVSLLGVDPQKDVAHISLSFPCGVLAHVHVSWADPVKTRKVVCVGSQQRIDFDDMNIQEPIRIACKGVTADCQESFTPDWRQPGPHVKLTIYDGDIIIPKVATCEPLKAQVEFFLEHVLSKSLKADEIPGVPNLALAVVRTMDAITKSISEDGCRVDVER